MRRGQRDRKKCNRRPGRRIDLDRLFAQIKLDGKDQRIDVVFTEDIRLGGELNGSDGAEAFRGGAESSATRREHGVAYRRL